MENAIKTLLDDIERASKDCGDPNKVAIAFGILMDKNAFGDPGFSEEQKKTGLTQKQRLTEYQDLSENG